MAAGHAAEVAARAEVIAAVDAVGADAVGGGVVEVAAKGRAAVARSGAKSFFPSMLERASNSSWVVTSRAFVVKCAASAQNALSSPAADSSEW